ncbi:MAG: right-handed parallel beta-helix repeat-containing protein [Acidimicrobiia bacterium]
MRRAYSVASLGDTVAVADGSYPAQLVPASDTKGQPDADLADVHFLAEGAAAKFAEIRFYVPHVRLSGVEVNGMLTCRYRPENPSFQASGDCHFDRVRVVNGGRVTFSAVKNFSITDSLIADNWRDGIDIYGSDSGAADVGHYPENGLVEDNVIRDLTLIDNDHIDGIQFTTGINVTIRNNQIGPRIHHQGLLAKTDRGPVSGIVVEGNTFYDVVDPGFSMMFMRTSGRECSGHVVSGNTFHRAPTPRNGPDDQCAGSMTGNTFTASMSTFACDQWLETWILRDNVFLSGDPCES